MHGMESVLSSLLTSPSGGCAPDQIQAKLRFDLSKGLAGILLKVAYIQFLEHPED